MAVNRRTRLHVQLDVDYYDDPKIIDAGEKAELLYLRGLAFCKKNWRADGFITDGQLVRSVAPGLTSVQARAKRLVEVGLWVRDTDDLFGNGKGYRVVAWLKRNPSAAEIEANRRADSDRKRVTR
jgi:hypothetical protein